MTKLFLIYGGKSDEHTISVMTAKNILQVIDFTTYTVQPVYIQRDGVWVAGPLLHAPLADEKQLRFTLSADEQALAGTIVLPSFVKEDDAIVFPVVHGPNGEDGTLQGLLETLDMPYVGANVLASACGMDKIISKKLFAAAGIPQLPYVSILKHEWQEQKEALVAQCEAVLTYPMFVKPANLGSSVGISKAEDRAGLVAAIELACTYDRRIVVETGVVAREVEVAVLGNENPQASVVGEVVKTVDFYDFEEKYVNNQATLQIPAVLPETVSEQIRHYALEAYKILDGTGLTRCDFFVTEAGAIYINEVNTMPGFTKFSMYPQLWEASGLTYQQLVNQLLALALARYTDKKDYQKEK